MSDSNPTRARHRENAAAFVAVMEVFLKAKNAQPIGSALAHLDTTHIPAYQRWTPDLCHTVIDVENAVKKVIGGQPVLMAKFAEWFGDSDELPEPALLESRVYDQIVQKCGAAFIKRRLFPIRLWFRLPDRKEHAA